jgi:hypothetical protein
MTYEWFDHLWNKLGKGKYVNVWIMTMMRHMKIKGSIAKGNLQGLLHTIFCGLLN